MSQVIGISIKMTRLFSSNVVASHWRALSVDALDETYQLGKLHHVTAWKVSKYGVISGPYFPVFGLNTGKYGPEITPYLDTFHAVRQVGFHRGGVTSLINYFLKTYLELSQKSKMTHFAKIALLTMLWLPWQFSQICVVWTI